MSPVAGIDGGGTRTRALILSEVGEEIGSAEGAEGIVTSSDYASAADSIEAALAAAARQAGVGLPLTHLCCGLAGAGSDETRRSVRAALEGRSLARHVTVTTDVDVALHDAFPDGEAGMLLVCGTGSIALGRRPDGSTARCGGWGKLLDDEGSGYWIGLEALRAVVRAQDGRGPVTGLTEPLLAAMGISDPGSLVAAVDRASKRRLAALAPLVIERAEKGDPVAEGIANAATAELVQLIETLSQRIGSEDSKVPVAVAGGLIAPEGGLHGRVRAGLTAAGFSLVDRTVVGVRGAARLALASSLSE